jgi:hypothetical protein
MEMGAGLLALSRNNLPADQTARFAMGFYGGYSPVRWLRAGINLNGWLIESFGNFYDDPAKGISVSNSNLQVALFPFKRVNIFTQWQGGISNYTNHHPNEYNTDGTAMKLGLGYEHDVAKHVGISLQLNFGWGRFKDVNYPPDISVTDQHYQATELLLGITYH